VRRWLRRIAWTIAGLVLAVGISLMWLARASLPQLAGVVALPGLQGEVTILRDAHAVPHVIAGSEADAYLAMGFLHGQDRLWQMEFDRLAGQGRLAELLGPDALPYDRYMRTLGLAANAERAVASLDGATLALLEAYATGVNRAIEAYGFTLPPEFLILRHRPAPWRPVDSVRFLKLMALTLSGDWRQELQRARLARTLRPDQLALLWPGLAQGGPVTMAAVAGLPLDELAAALPPPPPAGLGSNVWVAAGTRTATGRPLLANDPHLGWQIPGQWYLAQLEAPGLAVIGATLPGAPFVVLGRNRALAWGFTNTGSDTQDLFIERIDPAAPGRYLTSTGSEPFQLRTETIAVRGGAVEALEIRSTRHGPVISDLIQRPPVAGGHALALAWTQLQEHGPDTTAAAGFALGRAQTAEAFMAAAELYRGAQQNIAFATASGRIGMISPGLVPIRRSGDGRLPVPGWTGEHDWQGTIPATALPRALDPASGILVNANNRLVDESYPYLLAAEWEEPFRAARIEALLDRPGALDRAGFAGIQLDQVSGLARDLLPRLPPAHALPEDLRDRRDALAGWDGAMQPDRPEPLMFAAWRRAFTHRLAERALGPELADLGADRAGFLHRALATCPAEATDCTTAAVDAFVTAMAGLGENHGDDWREWRWGDAHQAMLAHRPLDALPVLDHLFSRRVPFGGDTTTVNVAGAGPDHEGFAFDVVHGAGFRAVYDLARPDDSLWIAATGQSGHFLSPHYADFVPWWRDGRYLTMSMDPDHHRGDSIGTLRLTPAAGS
jgi:penicillin amidase